MNDYRVARAAQYAKDYLDALYDDICALHGGKWPVSQAAFNHAWNKLAAALEQEEIPSLDDCEPGHVWEKTTLGWTLRKVDA